MCSNFRPASAELLGELGRDKPAFAYGECFPGSLAPFLANADTTTWLPGTFGLLPPWADPKLARHTYNARSETVATKPSYRHAWRQRQLAVVPVQCIFEPNYESGRPVRWRIERADKGIFGLAAIWEHRGADEGAARWSFSLVTINADEHPLMSRFHAPGKEKRSVVVLQDEDWDAWLGAFTEENVRDLLLPFRSDLMKASADPARKS